LEYDEFKKSDDNVQLNSIVPKKAVLKNLRMHVVEHTVLNTTFSLDHSVGCQTVSIPRLLELKLANYTNVNGLTMSTAMVVRVYLVLAEQYAELQKKDSPGFQWQHISSNLMMSLLLMHLERNDSLPQGFTV
jgi:hypothetical protein